MDKKILIKFLNNLTSEEEDKRVRDWLAEDHSRYALLDKLLVANKVPDEIKEKIPVDISLENVRRKISGRKRLSLLLRVAAVFIGLAFIVSVLYRYDSKPEINWNIVTSLKGEKKQVVLSDGTKVLLAPDSKLSYPEKFPKDLREVKLEGEAYFEVVHKPKHKFIVHTADADVEVLGTVFDVNAYGDSYDVSTVLISGRVKLYFKRDDGGEPFECLLYPSQKVVYDKKNKAYKVHEVNVSRELAWKEGRLIFCNETFLSALKMIERVYGVDIDLSGKMPEKKITGEFNGESLNEVMETLQEWTSFDFKIDNRKVFVRTTLETINN